MSCILTSRLWIPRIRKEFSTSILLTWNPTSLRRRRVAEESLDTRDTNSSLDQKPLRHWRQLKISSSGSRRTQSKSDCFSRNAELNPRTPAVGTSDRPAFNVELRGQRA